MYRLDAKVSINFCLTPTLPPPRASPRDKLLIFPLSPFGFIIVVHFVLGKSYFLNSVVANR